MAAKKKKSAGSWKVGFGSKNLASELRHAEALMAREKWPAARQALEALQKDFPQDVSVLTHLAEVYYELHDFYSYEKACDRLVQAAPNNAQALFVLGGAYLLNQHPLLALHTFRQALERFPNDFRAEETRKTVSGLESIAEKLLSDLNLSQEADWEVAVLHERGQAYLEQGEYQQARQAEEEVLHLKPDFVSARNNLCLISFAEGHLEQAITTAQEVLEGNPANVHALSNLTRFYVLNGQLDAARVCGERLKASQVEAWDVWTKKVEGLAYLGDEGGILQMYEQAKAAQDLDTTSALFHHLVAVAMARTGQINQAYQQWKQALKKSPGFDLSQSNLEDMKQPIGQRHAPWYFSLSYWLNRQLIDDLSKALAGTQFKDEKALEHAMQRFLVEHPSLVHLVPILLERGDPPGREFAFRLASSVKTPEMLQALKDFALSQWGPDRMRNEAAAIAADADLLSREKVRLYIQGEWRELMVINYELHDEIAFEHSRKVNQWLAQALPLLKSGDVQEAVEAEKLLRQAIQAEPNFPDLQNNLAVAYQIQGRTEEAQTLFQQLVEQYPDYVPARASVARWQIEAGELEAAEALLKPLLTRKRFHFQDFAHFCEVYLLLLVTQENVEAAKGWLNLWASLDPNHPNAQWWKSHLERKDLLDTIGRIARGELNRGKRKKK
jgi:tetratricopeptide (TPR) repeat protein